VRLMSFGPERAERPAICGPTATIQSKKLGDLADCGTFCSERR